MEVSSDIREVYCLEISGKKGGFPGGEKVILCLDRGQLFLFPMESEKEFFVAEGFSFREEFSGGKGGRGVDFRRCSFIRGL